MVLQIKWHYSILHYIKRYKGHYLFYLAMSSSVKLLQLNFSEHTLNIFRKKLKLQGLLAKIFGKNNTQYIKRIFESDVFT
jgi:hypothetical protein